MKNKLVIFMAVLLGICSGYSKAYSSSQPQGALKVPITRLTEKKDNLLVSTGIPFAPGQLSSDKNIIFLDEEGHEIAIATKILAKWFNDGSIRSVLVQFNSSIPQKYRYVTLKWGEQRTTNDLLLQEVKWEIPEGIVLLPSSWLCASKIAGEQLPMEINRFTGNTTTKYDQDAIEYFKTAKEHYQSGDTLTYGYYDTAHTFYQLYARTGNEEYFKFARKVAVGYRDKEIIQDGPERGRNTKHRESRYIYVEAMADDYLFTGDEKSLTVAGYMAEYLKNNFSAEKAFIARGNPHFWTEREQTFPFLGVITYYELTGNKDYLVTATDFMLRLYQTQNEWPERGGFIHNLYFHDPEEGCRKDEFGGSPFMTGLLLEAIVKYHWITRSTVAKESIFKALDWLKKECLAPDGDSFIYLTCDNSRGEGHPDLNLLIAHAFGYGYKISGYTKEEYLELGKKIFNRGVQDAWLGDQKHFNQNYRSSGHFLAYITKGD